MVHALPLKARLKRGVKSSLSAAALATGLYRVAASSYGGLGVVFMLHRVIEPGRPSLWPGFEIPADVLDAMLAATKRLGWEPVSIDEVERRLREGGGRGRFACFTLDDGYADNLELALPVFERHAAPLCVYVNTGLVERSVFYWWGALDELVRTRDRVDCDGRSFVAGTWAEKRAAYDALNELCYERGPDFARALLDDHGVDARALLDRDVLTPERVCALAGSALATVGAHGISHEKLQPMGDADARREIAEPRRILEGWTGRPVRHLAYPFGARGACGPREFRFAAEAGYATAVTTRRGNLFREHREHVTCLPRREIPLDEVTLRNALSGVETLLSRAPKVQTT